MTEEEEDEQQQHGEVDTFTNRHPCYVYQIPPSSSVGHRADQWDVDKWLEEGELFGECPVPDDEATASTAVEKVIDSSRYFVLRLVDAASRRHAFIGIGFRERSDASAFEEALHDHRQQIRRETDYFSKCIRGRERSDASAFEEALHDHRQQRRRAREAAVLRAQFAEAGTAARGADDASHGCGDEGGAGVSPAVAAVRKLSLKPGETLTLKAVKPSAAGAATSSWLKLAAAESGSTEQQPASGGSLWLPPPPETAAPAKHQPGEGEKTSTSGVGPERVAEPELACEGDKGLRHGQSGSASKDTASAADEGDADADADGWSNFVS